MASHQTGRATGSSASLTWFRFRTQNDIVGDNAQTELAGRLASSWWYDDSSDGRGYAHFALAGTLAFPDGSTLANRAAFRTTPEARTRSDWLDTGLIAGADLYRLFAVESVFNVGALQLVGSG